MLHLCSIALPIKAKAYGGFRSLGPRLFQLYPWKADTHSLSYGSATHAVRTGIGARKVILAGRGSSLRHLDAV